MVYNKTNDRAVGNSHKKQKVGKTMEKLFEIVSSFIPEEQKDDIKSKIDGEIDKALKEKETTLKRELSKTYGVNLFEEDVEKAYGNDKFIKKESYNTKVNEYEEQLKALKGEVETFKQENETFKGEKLYNETSVKLITKGFNPDRLNGIRPLIDGEKSADENVENISTIFPELFGDSKRISTTTPSPKPPQSPKTEAEKYIEAQKEKIR